LPTPRTPYVDCNDVGVVFVEARNEHHLEKFRHLNEHDETLYRLFPDELVSNNSQSTSLMGIQVNHFVCGGVGLAAATKNSGSFKPSYLFMPMDIRKSLVQNLPQTTVGNCVIYVGTNHGCK
ncbi:putative deacetylvindoline O-acetyltransferase, partial [Tanacetum coccineum]